MRNPDGSGRPFGGTSAREVIAETLARRRGWAEIPPNVWSDAGAIVKALGAAGIDTTRRKEQAHYLVEHRGGMTGRAWRPYTLVNLTREAAHHRADRRRMDAPEEEVRVRVRTVTYGNWSTDPA